METGRLFAGRGAGGMKMSEDEQIEIKVRDPDFREMIYRTCFMTINGAVFSALMEAGLRGSFRAKMRMASSFTATSTR